MRALLTISATVLALISALEAEGRHARGPASVPGEVIVNWAAAAGPQGPPLYEIAGHRVVSSREIGPRTMVYRLAERTLRATQEAQAILARRSDVIVAEPNHLRRLFSIVEPNDRYYATQWYLKAINLPRAWNLSTGRASIVVAVVDSGILKDHPDLQGRLLPGFDFISDTYSANDGDGWDADPNDAGTDDPKSSGLHGTYVAGIIGAASHNKKGLTGVDWRCKILPLRVMGVKAGIGSDADIAAAIRWAVGIPVPGTPINKHPARVINLSFGGEGEGKTLTRAIKDALAKGAIVVTAAGNQNGPTKNVFPAAIPGVITVGGTRYDGRRAPYSNYGPTVDIMAPGGFTGETLPQPFEGMQRPAGVVGPTYIGKTKQWGYVFHQGTSASAPIISGVAALMLAVNRTLNSGELLKVLQRTAKPKTTCAEGCGAGLVDAEAALIATGGNGTKMPFSNKPNPGHTVWGGGCNVSGADSEHAPLLAALLLLMLLCHRIRRRRGGGG
jgi:serine protease